MTVFEIMQWSFFVLGNGAFVLIIVKGVKELRG